MVLGKESKRSVDYVLSSTTLTSMDDINGGRSDRELAVLGMRKVTVDVPSTKYSEGNIVLYKAHHLSKANKGFYTGIAHK